MMHAIFNTFCIFWNFFCNFLIVAPIFLFMYFFFFTTSSPYSAVDYMLLRAGYLRLFFPFNFDDATHFLKVLKLASQCRRAICTQCYSFSHNSCLILFDFTFLFLQFTFKFFYATEFFKVSFKFNIFYFILVYLILIYLIFGYLVYLILVYHI